MWRTSSVIIDIAIFAGMTVAGMFRLIMILIALGVAALAAGPNAQYHAAGRQHPRIDAGRVMRSAKLDVALFATATAIAAYLAGRFVALLWGL
jgi:hypothetical protein